MKGPQYLGSAHQGTGHFIQQRLTALGLIPLSLWLLVSLIGLAGADYAQFLAWVQTPWVTVLLLLFLIAAFYHAALGIDMVIEDYVHHYPLKLLALLLNRFILSALGLAAVLAVLRMVLGG